MKLNEPYDQFPTLLQKLHNMPQDERVRELEATLRLGISTLDALLQEVQKTLKHFTDTAGEINRLENSKKEEKQ